MHVYGLTYGGFWQGRIVMVTKEEVLPYDRPTLSKAPGTPLEKMLLRDEAFYKVCASSHTYELAHKHAMHTHTYIQNDSFIQN